MLKLTMPVEYPEKNTSPESALILMEEIMSAWSRLPLEQQATMALTLITEVHKGEWGNWLSEEITMQVERETETGELTFPVYSLNWGNMENAFSEEEIAQLGDQDLDIIAKEMRNGFLFDSGFWYAVKMIGQRILEERSFSRWMNSIDKAVWMVAGCSVYDLPDYDFQLMFENGVASAEAANQVIESAGLHISE